MQSFKQSCKELTGQTKIVMDVKKSFIPTQGRGSAVGGVKSFIKGPIFAAKLWCFGKILMGGFVSQGPTESTPRVALVWVLSKCDGQSIVPGCGEGWEYGAKYAKIMAI